MIDWSPMHNVWIKDDDGCLQRADEPYYRVEKVRKDTWRILSDGDFQYLVAGEKEAISIDTGYGCGDIRAFEQTLTDVPVCCAVNTHDHFDHTANNCYFDKVYMAEETVPLATVPFPSFRSVSFPKDYPIETVDTGDVIDLGNRTLEVFKCPDHAVGSILLLDRREHILFCGDEIFEHGKSLRGNVEIYTQHLREIAKHRSEFDLLCAGSYVGDAIIFDRLLEVCEKALQEEGRPVIPHDHQRSYEPERNEQGEIVYHRKWPHPEDMYHPEEQAVDQTKLRVIGDEYPLTYSIDHLYAYQK